MTDDIKKIIKLTNLDIGEVVNDDVDQTYKGNICNEQGCLFDEKTYNFHLLHYGKIQFENYSNSIKNKRI